MLNRHWNDVEVKLLELSSEGRSQSDIARMLQESVAIWTL